MTLEVIVFITTAEGGVTWMSLAQNDASASRMLPSFEVLVEHMDTAGVPGRRSCQRVTSHRRVAQAQFS